VKALKHWRQQDLTPEVRAALRELIEAQRDFPEDQGARDALLERFMSMLSEEQLSAFSRLLRDLTEVVH
jgi:DNA-binding MarR family transcriptional regulator